MIAGLQDRSASRGSTSRGSTSRGSTSLRSELRFAVALLAAVALATWAAWPIYQTAWLIVVAAAGTVLGVALALLRHRLRPLPLIAVGLLAWLVTATTAAVPSAFEHLPDSLYAALQNTAWSLVYGWKQLLTLELPVGTYQAMLVPFFTVLTLACFTATALRRSAYAAIAFAAPVVWATAFGAAAVSDPLTLGDPTAGVLGGVSLLAPREVATWVATAALCTVWVWIITRGTRQAARRSEAARRGRGVRFAVATVLVALALVGALVALPVVEPAGRMVPRDRVDPHLVIQEQASPLAAYRASKTGDHFASPWFSIEAAGALPERLRLVTLDHYNSVDFSVSPEQRFARFPSGAAGADTSAVTVTVNNYRGIWAPVSTPLSSTPRFGGERSTALSDSFYVNQEAGTAIALPTKAGLESGDFYTVNMHVSVDPENPAAAVALAGKPGAPQLSVQDFPEMSVWLEKQETSDIAELVTRLRDHGYLSHSLEPGGEWLTATEVEFFSSPGGHSHARLESLFEQLNQNPGAVAAVGDDEQFAAAAALLARATGYESRVVLGFRTAHDIPGVPACDSVCAGENLAAWIEIRGASGVWAPLDVTPQIEEPPSTSSEGERLPQFPTAPEPRDAVTVDPPASAGDRQDREEQTQEDTAAPWLVPILRIVGLSLLGLLSLLVPLLFIPVAKALRKRSRRSNSDPSARALGAWNELRDRAVDRGVPLAVAGRKTTGDPLSEAGGSRSEQAEIIGGESAKHLANIVSTAVYSRDGITLEEADRAWHHFDEDRAQRKLSVSQRIRAAYSLRSLGIGKNNDE